METTCPLMDFKGGVNKAKEGVWDDERKINMEGEGNQLSILMKKMLDWLQGCSSGPSLWQILPQDHCWSQ